MSEYVIDFAVEDKVIVEPAEKSNIIMTEETSTIFKVVSAGTMVTSAGQLGALEGCLIIVAPKCVEKTYMGNKEIYFIRKDDILAVVKPA